MATGPPGAFTNNGCCSVVVGSSPEGHEIKNDVHDATINNANRPNLAGMLLTKITPVFSFLNSKTVRRRNFFRERCFSRVQNPYHHVNQSELNLTYFSGAVG